MTDRVGQPVCCFGRHHSIPFSTFDSAFKSHLIPFKNNAQYKKRQYSKIPFPPNHCVDIRRFPFITAYRDYAIIILQANISHIVQA